MSTTPDAEQPVPQPQSSQPEPAPLTAPPSQPQIDAIATGLAAAEPYAHTQPTVPLPETAQQQAPAEFAAAGAATDAAGGGAVPPAFGGTSAPHPESAKPRHGGLVAGIAIGALIGGLVGGGAAAIVTHNVGSSTTVQASGNSGSLTLNNLESATAVSGVAAVATPSVVTLKVSSDSGAGTGSGVIYSSDGYIITNAHVATLEGATMTPSIQVQLNDGTLLNAELVGSDPYSDIAVIKVDADGLAPATVADSADINVGDLAVVIGAPLSLSNTVTSGVVSALYRGISVASSMVPEGADESSGGNGGSGEDGQGSPFPWFQFESPDGQGQTQQSSSSAQVSIPVIQTDASINPGNSGGGLFNANGELIGINVALASNSSSTGTAGSDGLGFAVPSNLAARVADALIAGEQPSHGLLGVTQATDSTSSANQAGGAIGTVTQGSPAEKAGLRSGDVITSVDGIPADSFITVSALIRMHPGGSEITIGYNRDGVQQETTVTLDTLEG